MQDFGGLEEYAVTLAIGLQQRGHPTSVVSAAWVSPKNQYLRRLREQGVPVVQPPRGLSLVASDWSTKERVLAAAVTMLSPLVYLLAGMLTLVKRRTWPHSLASARGWLRRQLMDRLIGPDRRRPLACLLLTWWRFRWHPDLLHIHGYTTNLLFVIDWAYAQHLAVVYEEHATPDSQFDWWLGFQKSINKATTVVAVSEKSAGALRAVCGVTQPIAVRNPLLADPAAGGWQHERKSQQNDGPLRVTSAARLYVAKGLAYLLEAIVLVRRSHPATQFTVYGDGPLRSELLACADSLGLDGHAIFVGAYTERDELSRIMAQTDIFVLPSILEGQPQGIVEAMAYGCPIVTTSVGGIPEVIQDGINGLLCPPADPACLAENIERLIENPTLRLRLGRAARQSYLEGPFQPEAVCNRLVSIYENTLSRKQIRSI
jgi:glycosyltransferase involved in cell wall biosynthesis